MWPVLFAIACLFLVRPFALSQCRVDVSHTPVQELSLSDVDFEHFQSTTLLFTLFIPGQAEPYNATLGIVLNIKFADGSSAQNAVRYQSDSFSIPTTGRTVTNLDIGRDGSIRGNAEVDESVRQRLQDASFGTGSFPAGVYTFSFTVKPTICEQPEPVVLVIQSNTRIELRSPQDGETTGNFPLFEFYYTGDKTELIVAEKTPDQSRDDAIAQKPPMADVTLIGQESYLYSGGRPLEDGKTYVWRVIGKVTGANGQETDVPSQIGLFTVSSSAEGQQFDLILSQLEEIFGKRYPALFQEIHQQGFKCTGINTIDNTPLTPADLMNLLNQLREQSDSADLSFE